MQEQNRYRQPYQQPYPPQYYQQHPYTYPPYPASHLLTPADVNYRKLRKHGLLVGACLLGNYGIQNVVAFLLSLFGFGEVLADTLAGNYAVNAFFFAFLSMGVPFYLYSLRKGSASYFKALPFHTHQPRTKLLLVVLAGWALCMAGNFVATLAQVWFNMNGFEIASSEPTYSENVFDIVMDFVCAGFMAPLIEEFAFRGVIMQPLRRYGDTFAIYATALVFALAHGNPLRIVFAFVAGVAIGYAVVYTRSIWVGIIIHALNNCTSVFFSEIGRFWPDAFNSAYLIFDIALIVVGIICVVVFGKLYGFKLRKNASGVEGFKRVMAFFIGPTMIPVFIYFVTSMIDYIQI